VDTQDPQLLIVDQDPASRETIRRYLGKEGFRVAGVGNGHDMDHWLSENQAALIIMDAVLPGEDGFSVLRRLRRRCGVPVVMLSARGDDADRIVGLEIGADDYLAKPCNVRELLARVRAVLRRHNRDCGDQPGTHPLRFGPFELDLQGGRLTRDGRPVPLTGGEMDLLRVLAAHPGRILSRDRLLDLLKGHGHDPFDRSIDVQVARLRAKIEDNSRQPRFIRTVWGQGYRFSPEVDAS
jgi:two-component system phosphate regulon response regulator OmpR